MTLPEFECAAHLSAVLTDIGTAKSGVAIMKVGPMRKVQVKGSAVDGCLSGNRASSRSLIPLPEPCFRIST